MCNARNTFCTQQQVEAALGGAGSATYTAARDAFVAAVVADLAAAGRFDAAAQEVASSYTVLHCLARA
jgi:hypothetical protein